MNFIKDLFRPVLSDRTIRKYINKGFLIEGKIDENQFQPNSIDLTLGSKYKILLPNSCPNYNGKINLNDKCNYIDPRLPIQYKEGEFRDYKKYLGQNLPSARWFKLKPKQFALMASREVLNIPNGIISFVQGRSSIARLAIQIEQAGLIDSGFRGTITFEVYNQSNYDIYLFEGMRIAQVYFFKSQFADKLYGLSKTSKYLNQISPTGSKIYLDYEEEK